MSQYPQGWIHKLRQLLLRQLQYDPSSIPARAVLPLFLVWATGSVQVSKQLLQVGNKVLDDLLVEMELTDAQILANFTQEIVDDLIVTIFEMVAELEGLDLSVVEMFMDYN